MAAKLLHSLTDDNQDLHKQIGCMAGIFQLFDRQLVVAGGRRFGGHNPKRLLPPDNPNISLGRESDDVHLRPATMGKNPYKDVQEKHRLATESSRASLSSSSRSSSSSSVDCNRPTQFEPTSFDRIIFPDPAISLQNSSPRFGRKSLDLRDFVKDSMYREVHGSSGRKSKVMEVSTDSVRYRDSSDDIKEVARGLMRSSSYNHSKDLSSFAASKDAPRCSYDGRGINSAPFDVTDNSRHNLKYREFPRHPYSDSSECSVRNLRIHSTKQTPNVIAKLMGLEALPGSSSSCSINPGTSKSYHDEVDVDSSTFLSKNDSTVIRISSRSTGSWKGPRSARAQAKATTPYHSVYGEIEKRIKEVEFTESGKDLRELKQILDKMQSKGFLGPEKEAPPSNFTRHKDLKMKADHHQEFGSTKRRVGYPRTYQSPIVIMKPSASVIPLEGLGLPKIHGNEFVADVGNRTAKGVLSGYIQRDSVINYTETKSSEPISPRLQRRRHSLDRRSRPSSPPGFRKPRRQLKQQAEPNSRGGRRRLKHVDLQRHEGQVDDVKPSETNRWSSDDDAVANSVRPPATRSDKDSVQKDSVRKLAEEEAATEFGLVPPEFSSPISVLDRMVYGDDSPSTLKFISKIIAVDASADQQRRSNAASESSAENSIQRSTKSSSTLEVNRKKLENVENFTHDVAHTDHIASLCENADPTHRYISEMLLASGLLLGELTGFQFHPSGRPINPELFLVLERTKAGSLLQESGSGKTQRKLIFDSVNEILARKLTSAGSSPEPWSRSPLKLVKKTLHAQNLLRELCSEIEGLKVKNDRYSSDEAEDEIWRKILRRDVMHGSKSWTNAEEQISGAVLDIERSIFDDLVDETVIGDSSSAGSNTT